MVQALCRPNGTGPYSRSGSTKAKLAVPSLYPATSVTFGGLYRASAHNVPNLSTPGASEETPKIDAIGSDRGAVAVGTRVSSHAPRPEPYVRLSRIRLVWEFLCQGCITPFLSCFVASFFCSTRAASILPSRPHIAVAVARSGGQGRRFFSAAEGLSLTDASTRAGCHWPRAIARTTLVFG